MKFVSSTEIAAALRGLDVERPTMVVGGNHATPHELVSIADATFAELRLFAINCQAGWPVREGLETMTPFIGPGIRSKPGLTYVPSRLSLVPRLFDKTARPDVVLVQTSTPRGGRVSLGVEVNILPAAIEAVRSSGGLVVAQVNRQMPYTFGDAELDLDEVDLALEVDAPLGSPAACVLDDGAQAIAERVGAYLCDGATIQLGIGAVPDAVATQLGHLRGLGIWSEMISDGVLEAQRAGALDPSRPIVASFLFGSPELYEWAHENDGLVLRRTEVTNDPSVISAMPNLMAINTAVEVDLHAQANAAYVDRAPYSGFGGQSDFVVGSLHSAGGHAIIALRAWHEKSQTSKVVPLLSTPATSFQHSVIVSEHGAAEIFGSSDVEQASAIIEHVADPRARDALRDALSEVVTS